MSDDVDQGAPTRVLDPPRPFGLDLLGPRPPAELAPVNGAGSGTCQSPPIPAPPPAAPPETVVLPLSPQAMAGYAAHRLGRLAEQLHAAGLEDQAALLLDLAADLEQYSNTIRRPGESA